MAGRYRLIALLGEGGMGSAWRARDERLQRDVAVKQPHLPPGLTDEVRARRVAWMEREAQTAGRLRHPGIVTVYDQFTDEDGRPWIVMELVPGRSLAQIVEDTGRLPPERVARIGAQVAEALAAAHAAGIVHRDVKPGNVLLDGDRAVVTDFGIAALDGATTITPTGAFLGTPAYMAPEQINGQEATPASDVWSLGATLYYAVEGHPAFRGPLPAALLAVSRGKHAPMVHAGPLQPVLRDLLNKNPARRHTADRAAIALRKLGSASALGQSTGMPRRRLLTGAGAAGVVAAIPAGYYLFVRDEPSRPKPTGQVTQRSSTPQEEAPRWDRPTPMRPPLSGHSGAVVDVAFSPDGKLIATASEDHTVRIWDAAGHTMLGRPLNGYEGIHGVEFSRNGRLLATADGVDSTVHLWNVTSRKLIGVLRGHKDLVTSVAFSPDGKTLASAGGDRTVRLWDVATRAPLGSPLTGHTGTVVAVAFSPDGRRLASVGDIEDKTARLWDADRRTPIGRPLRGHTGGLTSLAFSPDGKTLASADGDGNVRLWDVITGTLSAQPSPAGAPATSVAFTPDGKTLAIGTYDGKLRLWDVTARTALGRPLSTNAGIVFSVTFSPDGKVLAAACNDGRVRFWKPSQ